MGWIELDGLPLSNGRSDCQCKIRGKDVDPYRNVTYIFENIFLIAEKHSLCTIKKQSERTFCSQKQYDSITPRRGGSRSIANWYWIINDASWKMMYFDGRLTLAIALGAPQSAIAPDGNYKLKTIQNTTKNVLVWSAVTGGGTLLQCIWF